MINKFFKLIFILAISVNLSAYKFPDELPNWQNIQSYKLANLKFGLTSVNEFEKLTNGMSRTEEGKYIIFSEQSPSEDFKSIRVGFKNDILDFIEFELKNGVKLNEITSLYGAPGNINNQYSTEYDYYDYDFFNIMTDKKHKLAQTLTVFKIPEFNSSVKNIINYLPDYKSFNFINNFIPGEFLERDFMTNFSGITPVRRNKFDTESFFTIEPQFLKSHKYYNEVTFHFKNGVLHFIGLTPKNLNLNEIKHNYGAVTVKHPAGSGKSFVEYHNFILLIDDKTNSVLNIGIVSSM